MSRPRRPAARAGSRRDADAPPSAAGSAAPAGAQSQPCSAPSATGHGEAHGERGQPDRRHEHPEVDLEAPARRGASACTRSRSSGDATGRAARSSRASSPKRSSTSSSGDIGAHLLLQLLQRAAQPRRARRRADPEHAAARSRRPARARSAARRPRARLRTAATAPARAPARGPRRRRPRRPRATSRRPATLAPAAALLGAEVVERGRARELAEPGARAPAARVEAAPALQRPGERLGCQVFGHVSVSRQVHEECVHVVEVAFRRLREVLRARLHGVHTSPPPHRRHISSSRGRRPRRRGRG